MWGMATKKVVRKNPKIDKELMVKLLTDSIHICPAWVARKQPPPEKKTRKNISGFFLLVFCAIKTGVMCWCRWSVWPSREKKSLSNFLWSTFYFGGQKGLIARIGQELFGVSGSKTVARNPRKDMEAQHNQRTQKPEKNVSGPFPLVFWQRNPIRVWAWPVELCLVSLFCSAFFSGSQRGQSFLKSNRTNRSENVGVGRPKNCAEPAWTPEGWIA